MQLPEVVAPFSPMSHYCQPRHNDCGSYFASLASLLLSSSHTLSSPAVSYPLLPTCCSVGPALSRPTVLHEGQHSTGQGGREQQGQADKGWDRCSAADIPKDLKVEGGIPQKVPFNRISGSMTQRERVCVYHHL